MQLSADEISSIIKKQIQNFDRAALVSETGTVLATSDGIARVYGLEGVMAGELVEFPGALFGLVLNLEQDNVGVAVLGDATGVKEGDLVRRTDRKSTRLNSSHSQISYAVFCLKKKKLKSANRQG